MYLKEDFKFELATECSSKKPFVVQCEGGSAEDLQTCNLLHENHKSESQLELKLQGKHDYKVYVGDSTRYFKVPKHAIGDNLLVKLSADVIETVENSKDYCHAGQLDMVQCQSICKADFQLQLCGCLPWLYSRSE